jgi:hypothetical protein
VAFGGRAFAFVGPSGAGKTSLAVQLVHRGGEFLTDDVLALEKGGDELLAHPGAAIASVRDAERAAIPDARWRGLGEELGHSVKSYVALPRAERPVPLAALYFLAAGDGPTVEPLPSPDPRLLLASTFVLGVQTPARLLHQLDVCAAIAGQVPAFKLRVTKGIGSEQLAALVHEHVESA